MIAEIFGTTYSILTGVVAVMLAAVASAIIFELNRDKETAMSKFHLNQEESKMDFKVFMAANAMMSLVFILFWVGSALGISALEGIGTYALPLYGLFMTLLFSRWWTRF